MKKISILFILTVALSFLLTSCGGGGGSVSEDGDNDGGPAYCLALPQTPTGFSYAHADAAGNDAPPLDGEIDGDVVLTWNENINGDTDYYGIFRTVNGERALILTISQPTTTIYTDHIASLTDGDEVTYQINAYGICNAYSGYSTPISILTKGSCAAIPLVPTGFTYTHTDRYGNTSPPGYAEADGDVGLGWDESTDADINGYYIYRYVNGVNDLAAPLVEIAEPATVSYTDNISSYLGSDEVTYTITAYDDCLREGTESAATLIINK
ncbi:MAG: hypothetical protein KAR06_10430 [Deltaproteobacteria bacterium]|nr:hypothetical protein [Deltaproteobacteria bacterium]